MTIAETRNPADDAKSLGRYRLRGLLGQGGMGRLFVAEQQGIAGFTKIVALKQIQPHLADSPEFRRMFLTEARVAARLEHPNIVVTYELDEVDGVYFIAMEYLSGEDLGGALGRCRDKAAIPVEISSAIAHQALSALHYAHELRDSGGRPAGLVHRDVNPSNIFITYSGMVKLLDFGVVKGATTSATSPGVFKGRYGYCAPEQIDGERIDRRTDLFCVGVVLWECLTGRPLFAGNTDAAVIDAARTQRIVPPSTIRSDIPAELDEITMTALARPIKDRFSSAKEMSEALDRFLSKRPHRPTANDVGLWLEKVFGAERAALKRAIAQGNDVEGALRRLSAMGGPAPTGSRGTGSVRSRGPLQARTLWSTSVGRPAPGPRREALAPVLGVRQTFVGMSDGAAADGKSEETEGDGPTSQFDVPHELAEAAGLTTSQVAMIPPPGASAAAPSPAGSSKGFKIIALVAVLGAVAVVALSLRDGASASSSTAAGVAASVALEIGSEPAGAHVLIDGEPTGLLTPTTLRGLRPGRVLEVRLDKPGFDTPAQKIEAGKRELSRHTFTLVPVAGRVTFDGLPQDATLHVNDVLTKMEEPLILPLGPQKLRIENGGAVMFERTVDIKAGAQQIDLGGRRGN